MGSLGMRELHHHIYNFGTTTIFLGLGKREPRLHVDAHGAMSARYSYPVAVVTDERVTPGSVYSLAFAYYEKLMRNTELLEVPPETVRYDYRNEYVAKVK